MSRLRLFLPTPKGEAHKTPFVFDDPISSLDHVYEEATASNDSLN